MRKSTSRLQSSAIVFSAAVMLALFAILAFGLPSVTFQSPTLSDNATTGLNWVFVNVTSTEDLNQSLLEWGNSTGFTNVSMVNVSGMTNWYINMTNLADRTYNYTIFAQNTTGDWNQTGRRFVTVCINYVLVNPGDSIQSAIDSLCSTGGVVELAAGTHNVSTPVNINVSNVTITGSGAILNHSDPNVANNAMLYIPYYWTNLNATSPNKVRNITIAYLFSSL